MYLRQVPNPSYIARKLRNFARFCRLSGVQDLTMEKLLKMVHMCDTFAIQKLGRPIFFNQYTFSGSTCYTPVTTVDFVSALKKGAHEKVFKVPTKFFSERERQIIKDVVEAFRYGKVECISVGKIENIANA